MLPRRLSAALAVSFALLLGANVALDRATAKPTSAWLVASSGANRARFQRPVVAGKGAAQTGMAERAPEQAALDAALSTAAEAGDAARVRSLLARGARPDAAVFAAVQPSNLGLLEILHQAGGRFDATLSAGVATNDVALVRWLLDHGARPHQDDLVQADANPQIVALLLSRSAEEPRLEDAIQFGAENAVRRLMAKGVRATAGDIACAIGGTDLAPEKRRRIVRSLLAAGTNPNPAADATEWSEQKMIETWRTSKSMCEGVPLERSLALCGPASDEYPDLAAPECDLELVRLLVSHRARVGQNELREAFALPLSIRERVFDILVDAPFEKDTPEVLDDLVGSRDAKLLRKVIAKKGIAWSLGRREGPEYRPLAAAIERLDVPLVEALLSGGVPTRLTSQALGGALALSVPPEKSGAIRQIVERLLAAGADPNGAGIQDPPLVAAASRGDPEVVLLANQPGRRQRSDGARCSR